jgi:adhesin/invasin
MLGCDKVPLTSPTGSTVTLTISSTSIPINGTAQVTAAVIESAGTAVHDGTMVTFVGALGNFAPPEAPTVGGVARTIFTATGSGTAKIGAFSGAAKATEVEVKVGGAAAEKVTVRTEPSAIPQTGGTVTVIAAVTDASGNPLPNTPINFTVDQGSLSSSSSTTDANGDARVTLTTNRTTKITANVAGKTAEFTVTALAAPSVAITGCTATQSVGVAVNCTITPTVATGGSPIQNLTVNWGDSTGEQPLGGNTGATSASHTYTAPGSFTMTAAATDLNSQRGTASITFVVNRVLPTGTLAVPDTGVVGVPVAMTFTPPSAPSQPISNVTIEFGDGGTRNLGAVTGATAFTRTYGTEGGYTVTAVITDASGQVGRVSDAIVISRSASPTITFIQSGTAPPAAVIGTNESFSISATTPSGVTVRSVVVVLVRTGETIYNQAGGGTFATNLVQAGDVLRATVTDSAGNTSRFDLVVQ